MQGLLIIFSLIKKKKEGIANLSKVNNVIEIVKMGEWWDQRREEYGLVKGNEWEDGLF